MAQGTGQPQPLQRQGRAESSQHPASPSFRGHMAARPGLAEDGCRSRYIPSEGVVTPSKGCRGTQQGQCESSTAPSCRGFSRHHCATARSAALKSPCAALSPAGISQTDQAASPNTHPPIKKHPKSLCTGSVCHISIKIYTNSTDPSSVDQNTATNHSV